MIGKAIIGKSFGGCIRYCLDKQKNPEILASNGIHVGTPEYITHQFKLLKSQMPAVENPVWHSSISFAHDDQISNDQMTQIAMDYLKEMKLSNNQFLIVKHNDTHHKHCHIIINRCGFDGKLARDWKSGFRTKKVMQGLEQKYDLTIAKDQKNIRKEHLKSIINKGISKGENLDKIFQRIEKSGFKVGINKTKKGTIRGISFRDDAKKIIFKASSLGRMYSYANLVLAVTRTLSKLKTNEISR